MIDPGCPEFTFLQVVVRLLTAQLREQDPVRAASAATPPATASPTPAPAPGPPSSSNRPAVTDARPSDELRRVLEHDQAARHAESPAPAPWSAWSCPNPSPPTQDVLSTPHRESENVVPLTRRVQPSQFLLTPIRRHAPRTHAAFEHAAVTELLQPLHPAARSPDGNRHRACTHRRRQHHLHAFTRRQGGRQQRRLGIHALPGRSRHQSRKRLTPADVANGAASHDHRSRARRTRRCAS